MAVDVSVYNEIARSTVSLAQCVTNVYGPCYSLGFANGVSAATTINSGGSVCQAGVYPIRLACDLIAQPWCCCYWATIPALPSVTAGLLVCDTLYARCGACCAWTVPSGAQFVRFQMWGAGALSQAAPCCCGISIPGSSGAYASVIIPAVSGCVYTLCAGCAMCCYTDYGNATTTGSGCSSWVQGHGLNNVCAEGGEVSSFCWMKRKFAVNGVDNSDFTSYCVITPNPSWICSIVSKGTVYGFCMCSNGGFCNSGSACSFSGCHCFITSCKTFRGNVTNATQCCHFVIGTPGVWSSLSGSGYGFCVNFPPVTCYCCCTSVQCYFSGCIASASGSCAMCLLYSYPCQRPDNAPGRGGGGASAGGGSAHGSGFPGNGGAVCVQYL